MQSSVPGSKPFLTLEREVPRDDPQRLILEWLGSCRCSRRKGKRAPSKHPRGPHCPSCCQSIGRGSGGRLEQRRSRAAVSHDTSCSDTRSHFFEARSLVPHSRAPTVALSLPMEQSTRRTIITGGIISHKSEKIGICGGKTSGASLRLPRYFWCGYGGFGATSSL